MLLVRFIYYHINYGVMRTRKSYKHILVTLETHEKLVKDKKKYFKNDMVASFDDVIKKYQEEYKK